MEGAKYPHILLASTGVDSTQHRAAPGSMLETVDFVLPREVSFGNFSFTNGFQMLCQTSTFSVQKNYIMWEVLRNLFVIVFGSLRRD